MKPLILITNDDGYAARGIQALTEVAREFGEVVVMAPAQNASAKSLSLTTKVPIRVRDIRQEEGLSSYACDGTPVDCLKLAVEHFCPRRPDLVLSGINHGSNSSINILYSGTMGAVLEATTLGFPAIGFSLLHHSPDADFEPSQPIVRHLVSHVLDHGLPPDVALNVNIPRLASADIKAYASAASRRPSGATVSRNASTLWDAPTGGSPASSYATTRQPTATNGHSPTATSPWSPSIPITPTFRPSKVCKAYNNSE